MTFKGHCSIVALSFGKERCVFKFLMKPKGPPLEKIETIIGHNNIFDGHLKCDGNIRIDGVCQGGVIETVGNVVVSLHARVAAKIIAEHVLVAGEVTGAIYARGYLEILSTGRVTGDVRVMNFYKDEAGILSGKLVMGQEALTGSDVEVPTETGETESRITPESSLTVEALTPQKTLSSEAAEEAQNTNMAG